MEALTPHFKKYAFKIQLEIITTRRLTACELITVYLTLPIPSFKNLLRIIPKYHKYIKAITLQDWFAMQANRTQLEAS
jgi:hypothetical protein